jgi:parallel beta-helix repeat protein
MSSNDQAQVINPIITGNIANGYSNTAAITTMIQRQLMDNFVQGDCVGGIISNNYTKNLGTEHIIVAGYNGTGQTNAPLLITGNVLDCTIPSGTYRYQSTTPLTNTVGIRADKMNVTVSNNIIYNASWGILLYGADYSTIQYKNTIIDSNTLFMHNDSSNTDIVISTGIQLQGYNSGGVNLLNGVISNNRIVFSGSTLRGTTQAIMVNDANPVTVKDNTVNISSITTGGNSIYYLSATRATVDMRRNMCNGVGSLTAWTSNTSSTINRFDLVLTTTGTSGPATITGDTLNIPQYSGGSSGITRSVNNVSTNTTAAAAANTDYVYNCTSALNLTLPTAVSNTNRYSVKNDSSGTVNVIFTSGQNADGSTTIAMIPNQALDFISDGTNYNIY